MARETQQQPALLGLLAQQLTRKMRKQFGDAAADAHGQEIIRREVAAFMRRAGANGVHEEDLIQLQNAVRTKLSGATPKILTYSKEKRAQVEGDEWAKIFQYNIKKGHALDRLEAEAAQQRKLVLRGQLTQQMQEVDARKKAERAAEKAYAEAQQASLRAWKAQEEMKRQQHLDTMQRLGQERIQQLQDKEERRNRALRRLKEDDADLAARIAYMTMTEMQREEQQLEQSRLQLKTFLQGNELNRKLREESKRKQADEDAEFQRQWAAKLDKQEADRMALLAKAKIKQDLQAAAAAERPECKRWLDQDLIDRVYREREAERDREEQRRKQRVKDAEKAAVAVLTKQMQEREEAKRLEYQREQEAARVVLERVSREEERERERRRRVQETKESIRSTLEAQMKENARRRRMAPMTETERKLNTSLLQEVGEWQLTGRLTL